MDARSVRRLAIYFIGWKLLLLLVIAASPGPGYDTSTTLLGGEWPWTREPGIGFLDAARQGRRELILGVLPIIRRNLVRWDSIYFLSTAERGYRFEQEWAFGYGYSRLLSMLSPGNPPGVAEIAWVGIALSHLCHFLSVLALYGMTEKVFGREHHRLAVLSAILHIVCPAGAFLSAPYGEALFSLLNFTGVSLYASALWDGRRSSISQRDLKLLCAGALFGLATTVRSNGLVSGIPFAYDALTSVAGIAHKGISLSALRRLFFLCLGGSFVAAGMVGPQYVAYAEYCQAADVSRRWCYNLPPSIYAWVQSYYWNVGFLKYWTLSNIPLFILAAPMLFLLTWSSSWALFRISPTPQQADNTKAEHQQACLTRFALPQAILTLMALMGYHVQIITRLSSGYPLWYWFLSSQILLASGEKSGRASGLVTRGTFVRGMVLYAVIQGALFGSFLPPA